MVMEPLERHGIWTRSHGGAAGAVEYAQVRKALHHGDCRDANETLGSLTNMCRKVGFGVCRLWCG